LIESLEDVRNKILPVARQKQKIAGQKDRTAMMRIVNIIEDMIESSSPVT
jgi:hypothetical protein